MGSFVGQSPVLFQGISYVTADSNARHPALLGAKIEYLGEEYRWIHNASNSDAALGESLITTGLSGYSLTNTSLAAVDLPMCGVKHVTIPTGGYGWGLTRGIMEAAKITSTLVTGIMVTIGADGDLATFLKDTFPTGPLVGRVLSSGTGTAKVYCKYYG
jgi:hypothetical protein